MMVRESISLLSWLLLVFMQGPATTSGQGVFLQLRGVRLSDDSLVDIDDIRDETVGDFNLLRVANSLMCMTDLVACCNAGDQKLPQSVGEWHYPDGSLVVFDAGGATFRRNRGQSVIRLWRRGNPMERGRFRCELPDTQNVSQIRYFNILDIGAVSVSPPGTTTRTVGENFNLQCSVDITPNPLPQNVPTPSFEWFFGSNNASLPSGVTVSPVTSSGNTYTSTLQFSPLQQFHAGMYTCRLGGNARLASGVTVTAAVVTVTVTGMGQLQIGLQNYRLHCTITGTASSASGYMWLKDGVKIEGAMTSTLSFPSLRLSDAGLYTCEVNINSAVFRGSMNVSFQIPAPISVNLTSNPVSPIRPIGSNVTLTCIMELSNTSEIDVPLNVSIQILRATDPLTTTPLLASGSTYTSSATINSFGRDSSENYTCMSIVRSNSSNVNLVENMLSNTATITVGVYLMLNGRFIEPDSAVAVTEIMIRQSDDDDGSLQCITDKDPCCRSPNPRLGEWYLPNKVLVQGSTSTTKFYRSRGDSGEVFLNRPSVTMSPAGRFCCEVPDATGNNQTVCVNIVSVSITAGPPPIAGQKYSLTCNITEAEKLNSTETYQWIKSNGTVTQVRGNSSTLTFSPLRLSDASNYTCRAIIRSTHLSKNIIVTDSQNITIEIPPLSSVNMISNPPGLIRPVGTVVTLTCIVELGPAVMESDLPLLLVDAQLSRNGTTLTLTDPMVTGITFTYTIQLGPFGRNDSGNYTCTATVKPQSESTYLTGEAMSSDNVAVTTGVYLSLRGKSYTNNSVILITDIGQTLEGEGDGGALLCYTDNVQCCDTTSINGRWLLPDQSEVASMSDTRDFYVDTGPSVVRLHRRNNATSLTGVFCCEVPDATSVNIRTCIDIVLMLPTTATDNSNSESQRDPDLTGTIVGVVIAVSALLIASALIIIVVIAVLRRHSSKPYPVSSGKTPVAYSRAENGEKVQVFGVAKNVEPHIIEFPSDTNITEGEGVYFKIRVSGVPQPTVTWYHDGEPVKADYAREIEADGSLAIPSTELKHSGEYKAVVANQHGSEERELKLTVNEEGGASTGVVGEVVSTRPIPIPKFGKYVADLHANSNQPFKDLYQALDSGEEGHTTAYARDVERKPLNRFGNIIVYDDNRIALQPLPDVPDCQEDYINASYVDGYSIPRKFIATQGPLPKTVVDFWRLIWQEHPPTIVMVTNVTEGNRIKCQQYWPESGQAEFGPFQVIITDQQIFADYTIRTLSLSLGSGRSHKVTQYHFTAWPDHGVPDYATPILAFHRRVKAQHHPSRGPMVVHCSAGVGRTGTFIVIDNALEQIEKEQMVDIPGAITKIRQKRMKMVQTHEQFTFIHDAILESVTCGDTQLTASNLRSAISKMNKSDGFQYQMKILEQVSPNPDEVRCDAALNFPERNRGTQFLPADRWRVILKGEQPDYIHAVTINGYKHQKAFIIAQGPMESTVRNFWKIIYDRKCAVVVMVSGLVENRQESSAQYWPGSGVAQHGEYTVDLLGEEPLEGFTIRELSVMDNKIQKAHKVTQFHITCWMPDGRCSNLKSVTDVIEEMTKVQIRSGNKPIVVHCNDTVTRSGMFCAIATTIERCKTEGVVDVFQVVKALRVQKPGAVPTVDQYKLIFETALVFLESFDTYANFQI